MAILSLFLLHCEQIEPVLFAPIVGSVDENHEPTVISVDIPCTPSDLPPVYPTFNTRGATSLFTFDDGAVGAATSDCRGFFSATIDAVEQGASIDMDTYFDMILGSVEIPRGAGTQRSDWANDPHHTTMTFNEWDEQFHPHACILGQAIEPHPTVTFDFEQFPIFSFDEEEALEISESDLPAPFKWISRFYIGLEGVNANFKWPRADSTLVTPELIAGWITGASMPSPTQVIAVGGLAYGALYEERDITDVLAAADDLTGAVNLLTGEWNEDSRVLPEDFTPLKYAPDVPLVDVWARSVADFWVVGNDLQRTCPRVTGKVFHCNDKACEEEVVVPGVFLKSIFALSESDIYVVGGNGEENTGGVLLRRHKGAWSRVELPTDVPLNRIRSTAINDIYIVGGALGPVPSSVALKGNDDGWQVLDIPTTLPLYDMLQTEDGVVHFAGAEGFYAL